jgi:Spy/CpxP family protein refolding chaperone
LIDEKKAAISLPKLKITNEKRRQMNWKHLKAVSAAGALTLAMLATGAAQTAPTQAPTTGQAPSAPAPGAHAMHKKHAKAMQNEMAKLNLTDDQKSQIKGIKAKAREQAQAVKSDASLTPAQKQDKIKSIRQDTRKQVMSVLTPEQQKQFHQDMKEHRQQAKQQKQQPS